MNTSRCKFTSEIVLFFGWIKLHLQWKYLNKRDDKLLILIIMNDFVISLFFPIIVLHLVVSLWNSLGSEQPDRFLLRWVSSFTLFNKYIFAVIIFNCTAQSTGCPGASHEGVQPRRALSSTDFISCSRECISCLIRSCGILPIGLSRKTHLRFNVIFTMI